MAIPQKKLTPASEDLVRLRDEIAMHALNGLLINGKWTKPAPNGGKTLFVTKQDYAETAYSLADEMLAARERK